MKYHIIEPVVYNRTKFGDWNFDAVPSGSTIMRITGYPLDVSSAVHLYTFYNIKNKKELKNIINKQMRNNKRDAHKFVSGLKKKFNTNLTFGIMFNGVSEAMKEVAVAFNSELFKRCEEHLEDEYTEWFTLGVDDSNIINTPLYHHIGFKNKEDKLKFILLM